MTDAEDDMATELVVPETHLLFDRADDAAVLARIQGATLQACVYAFRQGGAMIYGLGIDGAEACKRELARMGEVLEEEDVEIERDEPEAAYFKARCSRWGVKPDGQRVKLDSALGVKRQGKFITRRDGATEPNPFWFEQGCAKAVRNAILRLAPQELQQRVIEAYKQQGKVREVQMDPETAGAMVEEAHGLFPKSEEEQERLALIPAIRAIIRDDHIPEAKVKKLKEVWLGSAEADPMKADVAALRALRDHLRA